MTAERKLLGRTVSLGTRERVFEVEDALEVDATDQYEVTQKRVLFEDVVLITYHRELGWGYIAAHGFVMLVFLLIAGTVVSAGGGTVGGTAVAIFAVPSLIAIIIRLVWQVDVIAVFGRRSRAKIAFFFRKKRARELYGHLCHRVRQVQREIEDELAPAEVTEPPTPT